jgi:membrane-bound metal-dependent hydrolase YbcI (DUF457 family)
MSSLLGHVLGAEAALGFGGPLAVEDPLWRRGAWTAALIAVIPDLDVGLYILAGRPGWLRPHVGLSHSLLFAALLGLAGGLWLLARQREARGGQWPGAVALMAGVAAVHPLMDLLAPTPMLAGVPLLWPFAKRPVSFPPVQVLPEALYATEGFDQLLRRMLLDWRSWAGMMLETIILLPLVVLAWRRTPAGTSGWALVAVSCAGLVLTVLLYTVLDVL